MIFVLVGIDWVTTVTTQNQEDVIIVVALGRHHGLLQVIGVYADIAVVSTVA